MTAACPGSQVRGARCCRRQRFFSWATSPEITILSASPCFSRTSLRQRRNRSQRVNALGPVTALFDQMQVRQPDELAHLV